MEINQSVREYQAAIGRLGGLAHGWKKMSPEARQERARKAGSAKKRKRAKKQGKMGDSA